MRKQTDREKLEAVFTNPQLAEGDARHLLDIAGVIVRSRFPGKEPPKRARKPKGETIHVKVPAKMAPAPRGPAIRWSQRNSIIPC